MSQKKKIPRYKLICDHCDVGEECEGVKGVRWTKTFGWRVRRAGTSMTVKECADCSWLLSHFCAVALSKGL